MSNSFPKRLALATRGFRGGSSEKTYINEEFTIQEIFETVDIISALPTVDVVDIDILVASVEEIGVNVEVNSDTITIMDVPETTTVDSCE